MCDRVNGKFCQWYFQEYHQYKKTTHVHTIMMDKV